MTGGFTRTFRVGISAVFFFLIATFLGNSLFFFGKSDENYIINISAILLFVLYLCIDMIVSEGYRPTRSSDGKLLTAFLPIVAFFAIIMFYSDRIKENLNYQFQKNP